MRSLAIPILFFSILSLVDAEDFLCEGNHNIDTSETSPSNSFGCGTFQGPVRLVWEVTGNTGWFFNDEYTVELYRDDEMLYQSREFSDENEAGRSELTTGGNGTYTVSISCRNEAFDCTYGRFLYRLVPCGCQGDDQVVLEGCVADSYDSAYGAICGGSCDPGFYSDPVNGCTECPNFKIIYTSKVSYENLLGKEECGVQGTTGFWSLAAQGSVGSDGTIVDWSLTRSQSVSDGVERTREFAEAYGQVRGSSTSFETSVSEGFTTSVSAGFFGTSVGVESSIDVTTTSSETKSYEVSTESTNTIANAVTSVITNDESITCSQSCGPNPEDPNDVQGFIYNWVDAIYDENSNGILHYVRTCATVCKYDNIPPLCPPGKCFNRECSICEENAFLLPELDQLASMIPPTIAPTSAPIELPDSGADDTSKHIGFVCIVQIFAVVFFTSLASFH